MRLQQIFKGKNNRRNQSQKNLFSTERQDFYLKLNIYLYRILCFSLFFSILFGLAYFLIHFYQSHTTYCDSHPTNQTAANLIYNGTYSKCNKCPVFANCTQGSCQCDPNYMKIGYYCIYNDTDAIFVSKMLETSYDILKRQSGLSITQDDKDWVSSEELENLLIEASHLNGTTFYRILEKTLLYLNNDTSIVIKSIDNITVYISKDVSFDLASRIRLYIYQHLKEISIFTFILFIFSIVYLIYENKRMEKEEIMEYSHYLFDLLRNKKGRSLTRSQMVQKLDMMTNNHGLAYWPKVEKRLKQSKGVQCFNEDTHPTFRFIM